MFRKLTPIDIKHLIINGCSSENWEKIKAKVPFRPSDFNQVIFEGNITLGLTGKNIRLKQSDGQFIQHKSNISDSHLHDSVIGDNCYIRNTKHLSNAIIGKECFLINLGYFSNSKKTTFGNGSDIRPLIETGGRSLPLWVGYTASLVDLLLFHPKKNELKKKVLKEINKCAQVEKHVGDHSLIFNVQKLLNVTIGSHAALENITYLKNSSIESSKEFPTIISNDVISENVIIKENVVVKNGVLLENCFIGKGSKVSNQASIKHSFLFSNNHIEHSEITACLLGQHTVSHHKSSLLIAGKFSFYNVGSGSNMSNHKHRLGPLHQGILERGCKSGSGSYMIFPSHIGSFTTIIGRHFSHLNTSHFPFSLLYEEEKKSMFYPGFNIGRIGLYRDIKKWEERKVKTEEKNDLYHSQAFNPYTLSESTKGYYLLNKLLKEKNVASITNWGIHLNHDLIHKGLHRYKMLFRYVYYQACYQALKKNWISFANLKNKKSDDYKGQTWIDMGGVIIHLEKISSLMQSKNITALNNQIKKYFTSSQKIFSLWTINHLKDHDTITDFKTKKDFFDLYQNHSLDYLKSVLKDSKKEFAKEMQIGYGLYGSPTADFNKCHGQWKQHRYVADLIIEIKEVENL